LSLRKVEEQVLIPKIMRERAKTEKCVAEVKGIITKLQNQKSPN
jgi:hypothetical protein